LTLPKPCLYDPAVRVHPLAGVGRASRRIGAPLALLCLALIVSSSCGRSDASRIRERLRDLDVILISVDTLRADHVGAYGDRAGTPNLDRLAGGGVVFERCIAQTPLTLPSHTSLLSGSYPLHHRVRSNGGSTVPDELELVSEILQGRDFATAAFVGAYVLHSKWGLDQGFDLYDDAFDRSRFDRLALQNAKPAEEVIASAREWLGSVGDRRFFAWIHLFDPHTPYEPPPPFDRYPDEPYRGEVEYTDHAIGTLLDFLDEEGRADRTLIIVTADHGESLGEHGENEHGFFVYEAAVRVPLIIRAPVELPVQRWGGLVELVDVAPTILDALGVAAPESWQGESLWPVVLGESGDPGDLAYTETYYPRLHYGWSELRALYRDELKYISAPRPELYRPAADAEESQDLVGEPGRSAEVESMNRALVDFVDRHSEGALAAVAASLSREDRRALEALGYTTTRAEVSNDAGLADPKDMIGVFNELADATGALDSGRADEAIVAARRVIAREPRLIAAHILLGNAYRRSGRLREAADSYRTVLELDPDANFSMIDLIGVLLDLGAWDEAIRSAEVFIARFPDDPVLHEQAGFAHAYQGNLDLALEHLERAISIEPSAITLGKAGEVSARAGDAAAAEAFLERAIALNPGQPGCHLVLAQIEERRGNPERAIELYERELANDPRQYRAAFGIALIHATQGRMERAIPYCRRTIEANPGFHIPYFMIAAYHLERNTGLEEAIELCIRGIEVAPIHRSTLTGYQTLLRLLERTGDWESHEEYSRRAHALARELERAR
jgi:arylsulfatase A-like enzyme/Tfp pilus assembly protein PilF